MQTMKALLSLIHWFTALLLPLGAIVWPYLSHHMTYNFLGNTDTGEQTCLKYGRSRPGRHAQP